MDSPFGTVSPSALVPMMPPPPEMFLTTMFGLPAMWFGRCWAMIRPSMSFGPLWLS